MSDYVIETRGLTKTYGEQNSVSNLSIHVRKGRIYGLLGRNGAGKTTTMRMLLGLTAPSSGDVKIFGKPLRGNEKKYPASYWFSDRVAWVLSEPDGNRKSSDFCRFAGTQKPQIHQRRVGGCQPSVPGQKAVFPVFAGHEAASCHRTGCHAQPGTTDFG